ncbi:complement component receptor 1-like protein isoform X2 [Tachypleus tridentatus]|uniref:complement component receptor 1-like protein isoform X2 n=1 Tax=Tachypleus tridentatus TaxID=6853 RepID=UPI003FD3608A
MTQLIVTSVVLLYTYGVALSKERCGYPGRPAYGNLTDDKDGYEPGETITFHCNNGYFLIGANTRRCLADGTWSGQLPVCDSAIPLTGAVSASDFVDSYPPKNAINPDTQSCTFTKNGTPRWWRVDLEKTYHVLSVAVTIPVSHKHLYQQFTIFVINSKNNSAGDHKCSSFRGKFYRYTCGEPDRPIHAYTLRKNGIVEYYCALGYSLEGSIRRSCLDSGQWDGIQRTCVEVTCRLLENIQNGNILTTKLKQQRPVQGSIASYSCKTGYVLHGNATRVCQDDGGWSGEDPECHQVTCQLLDNVQNGSVLMTKLKQHHPVQGSIASYSCKTGYVLHGNATRVCQDDGGWSGEDPECHQVTCQLLDNVQNGSVLMTKLKQHHPVQGSIAFYSCKTGYVLHGNATRVCQDDGGWSGEDPECHPIHCATPLPQLPGGKYTLLNETTTYHSIAELECLNEFQVSGPMPLIRCQENGSWSFPQASCVIQAETDANMKQLGDGNDFTLGIVIGIVPLGIVMILFVTGFIILRRRRCSLEKQCTSLSSKELDSFVSSSYLASTNTLTNNSLYPNKHHCSELPLENNNQESGGVNSTNKDIGISGNIEPSNYYSPPNLTPLKKSGNSSTNKSSTSEETIYQDIHLCKNYLNYSEIKQKRMDNKYYNNTEFLLDGGKEKREVNLFPSTHESSSKSSTPVVLDPAVLALYAKVDFDKKRAKNLETWHTSGGFEFDKGKALNTDSRKENSDTLSFSQSMKFSSNDAKTSGLSNAVPFRLCEHSVIPAKEETDCLGSDRNHTDSNHILLSEEPCVFLDNAIYAGDDNNATIMIENDLYSTI